MTEKRMSIWTIYDHPRDYPDSFVARRWEVGVNEMNPTNDVIVRSSLRDLRECLPDGLVRVDEPDGDPVILECWL